MGSGLSRLFGVGCLLGALYCAHRSVEFHRHGVVVPGTVVAIDAKLTAGSEGLDYSERTEVRYRPKAGGKSFVLHSNWNNALFGKHELGDTVQVRYLPDRPDDAREASWLQDWLLPLILLVLGVGGLTGRLQSDSGHWEFTLWRDRKEE